MAKKFVYLFSEGNANMRELLGYFLPSLALMLGDQNMLQRFASAKNSDEAKKSNIGPLCWSVCRLHHLCYRHNRQ